MLPGYVVNEWSQNRPAYVVNEWSQYRLGQSTHNVGTQNADAKVLTTNWNTQPDYLSDKWLWEVEPQPNCGRRRLMNWSSKQFLGHAAHGMHLEWRLRRVLLGILARAADRNMHTVQDP